MNLTITVARTEDLDDDARSAVVDVCVAAHDEPDFRRLFAYFIPSGGHHALAHVDGTLVAHAVATTRWMQPEGLDVLKTAYIDAVATLPDHQGRGIGSSVMRSLAEAVDGEYAIGCLETGRITFYERVGWEVWRGPLAGRGPTGIEQTPDQTGIMILRLSGTPDLDLDRSLTIERQPDRIW